MLLAFCYTLFACSGQPTEVFLDLCQASAASQQQVDLLRRATTWSIEVLGIESDDVAWRRNYVQGDLLSSVTLSAAIIPQEEVRIIVEGFGPDIDGNQRLVGLCADGPFSLNGGEQICLCCSPPEDYLELCPNPSCTFDEEAKTCGPP